MSADRPRIFIDENLPHQLAPALGKAFRRAIFSSHAAERLSGTLDLPLFAELSSREFNVLITKDLAQLAKAEERDGIRNADLHWVGVREPDSAKGIDFYGALLSALAATVPAVIKGIASPPHAYYVHCEHLQWNPPIRSERI